MSPESEKPRIKVFERDYSQDDDPKDAEYFDVKNLKPHKGSKITIKVSIFERDYTDEDLPKLPGEE